MKDLFSQCTYVSVTLRNVNLCSCACSSENLIVTCTNTGEYRIPSEDREERRFLTMVDPPQRTRFAESSTEHSRRFAALRKRNQGTVEAKRAGQEQVRESAKEESALLKVFTS